MPSRIPTVLAALALLALPALVRADALADAARKVADQYRDSIVNVTAVAKIEFSGLPMSSSANSQESKIEAIGTVIDADGMIVLSAGALNPANMIGEVTVNIGGENQTIKPHGTTTDIKIRMPDGREFAAKQVFTDSELDMTFLVPDLKAGEEAPKFTPLKLAKGAKAGILDQVIGLSRLNKQMNYEPAVVVGRIVALLHKPRTLYIAPLAEGVNLGAPVFTAEGATLGFIAVRRQDAGAGGSGSSRTIKAQATTVVLPMDDVIDLVDQARKAAKEKKDEKPAAK